LYRVVHELAKNVASIVDGYEVENEQPDSVRELFKKI
jgi:hypothetical protein